MAASEISFRANSASPINKLSCFAMNRWAVFLSHSFIILLLLPSTTGDITLEASLDRETDPLISLVISAHDGGMPSKLLNVCVCVAM